MTILFLLLMNTKETLLPQPDGSIIHGNTESVTQFVTYFPLPLWLCTSLQSSSVQLRCSVVSDSLQPHESQYARPPCPSTTPRVYSNSRPSSQWCHPAISSSVVPFSSCPQSLKASGSFPMSQLSFKPYLFPVSLKITHIQNSDYYIFHLALFM